MGCQLATHFFMSKDMCGRISITEPGDAMAAFFKLDRAPKLQPRYNVPPTSKVGVVLQDGSKRRLAACRWGIVPSWAEDPEKLPLMFNAREETIFEKASFSASILYRRCLIPANSFFEWQIYDKKQRQPFLIQPKGMPLFGFAGIWDCWRSIEGENIYSTAIITTAASQDIQSLHHRMPVILPEKCFSDWLAPSLDSEKIQQTLTNKIKNFTSYPVSSLVNSLKNQGPETTQEIDPNSSDSPIYQKRLL
jgi:putative SOS response-associated peptidase YedK